MCVWAVNGVALVLVVASDGSLSANLLMVVVQILSIVALIMISARRWHDLNKSGWWSLVLLIPIAGPIWWFVAMGFLKGTWGHNKYGPGELYLTD